MRFKHLLFYFLFSVQILAAQETPISGVINEYASVNLIDYCSNAIGVDDPSGFEIGMQVILIQMKGASINSDNNGDFGDITDLGEAGFYEKNKIVNIVGSILVLEKFLLHDYDTQNGLQLVSMPVYENAITTDSVIAQPWNGSTGGIVAFEVLGELKIDAPIVVSEQGFRGGAATEVDASGCNFLQNHNDFSYEEGNWRAAPKGESIASFVNNREWGKGSQASGGGGGNNHNAGGGGGANLTPGGNGGRNNVPGAFDCKGNNPGLGGKALPEEINRIFMGGGGGAGHANGPFSVSGGNGGGIVLIKARKITRVFAGIYADGGSPGTGQNDGAGGAGAGGTILLEVDTLSADILVHAFGGNGGNIDNLNANRCFGPGGGGSGGRIMLTLPVNLPSTNFQIVGGQAGRSINSTSCEAGSNGAEAGENGIVSTFDSLEENTNLFETPQILNQPSVATVCTGNPLLLEVETSGNNLSYQWQINRGAGFENLSNDATFSGTQTPALSVTEAEADILTATFRLTIDDGCGNQLFSNNIPVEGGDIPDANFNLEINNLTLTAISVSPDDADTYFWDFGDGNTSTDTTPTHIYDRGGDYPVKLVISNSCGRDSLTQIITAVGLVPTAAFSYSDTTGCGPVSVNFFNESTSDAVSFQWTFLGGMPATSMEEDPVIVYESEGTYQVRLIVANIDGAADTLIREINVVFTPEPTADFDFVIDGLNVSFENLSQNASDAFWDFGDGVMSMDTSPVHNFPATGSYDVQLIVTNLCGRDTLTVGIDVIEPPAAAFVVQNIEGCSPKVITFQNQTSGDYDRLAWSFQGGTPDFSTDENPVVTYNNNGIFEVVLVATNAGGSTTAIQSVEINLTDPPTADFIASSDDLNVEILSNPQNADSLCWFIEQDGIKIDSIEGALNAYTFENPGTYTFLLIAKNDCGRDSLRQTVEVSIQPVADFIFDTNSGCSPLAINIQNNSSFADEYEWIFEGGFPATSTEREPVVEYLESGEYVWTLIAKNSFGGDTIQAAVSIEIFERPIADFEENSIDVFSISLKSLAQDADSICWIVENQIFPGLAIDSNFTFTFPGPGIYNYGLVAKNECGTDTLRSQITIDGIPKAEFEVLNSAGCAPLTIEISSPYFSPPLLQFLQDFQITGMDGENFELDQANSLARIVTTSDKLIIQMVVGSQFGSDTLLQEINLNIDPLPIAGFNITQNGNTLNFLNQSVNAIDYLWDFGDNMSSQNANPSHTYSDLGDYQVQLIVTNDCGQDTLTQSVRVNIAPVAAFDIVEEGSCAPFEIRLLDQSEGLDNQVSYEFSGPAVLPIDEANGVYEVRGGGELEIIMTVQNELGTDVNSQTITIQGPPNAAFASQRNGLTVSFEDQSTNADDVSWNFGDGNASQEREPIHTYAEEGEYTIQMIVSNDCGQDTVSRNITVGEVLQAKFIALNSFGCSPHLVQFQDKSNGNYSTRTWSFPGGTPAASTEANPQVVYTEPGTYSVTLMISGPLGTSSSVITNLVTIVDFPKADFSYEVDGFQVRFTNLSSNSESYRWDFGDGTVSEDENPVHTYNRGGVFSVTLNASIATCGSSVTMNIPVMLTDVEDVFTSNDFRVYPNPTRENLFIESLRQDVFPLEVSLLTQQGQILMQKELNFNDYLNMSAYPSGTYYISLRNNEKQWVGRILKLE